MRVDELECDKKSYLMGLKTYMSCVVDTPEQDDNLFVPDVEEVEIHSEPDDLKMSRYGTYMDFDEPTECTIGEEIRCRSTEDGF